MWAVLRERSPAGDTNGTKINNKSEVVIWESGCVGGKGGGLGIGYRCVGGHGDESGGLGIESRCVRSVGVRVGV